jgi:hypothetical protein
MTISSSYNYVPTRDQIIARALRIVGALGQGETAPAAAVTEATFALNDIIKEWQADGMLLWKEEGWYFTPTSTVLHTIGIGQGINRAAPQKILVVMRRKTLNGVTTIVPLEEKTLVDFNALSPTTLTGVPQFWSYRYNGSTYTEPTVSFYMWPIPSADFISDASGTGDILVRSIAPIADFDAAGDHPDVPSYLFNALTWALADQICYEYGVPIAERAQIAKKAQTHKAIALAFDQQTGSLFLQPYPNWEVE